RLEVLPDDALPSKGPGRAENGNFVLNSIELRAEAKVLPWSAASATHSQESWAVSGAIDSKPETGWAILPETGKTNSAVFELKDPVKAPSLELTMRQNFGTRHMIGKFRLWSTDAAAPVRTLPNSILGALALSPKDRSDKQKEE